MNNNLLDKAPCEFEFFEINRNGPGIIYARGKRPGRYMVSWFGSPTGVWVSRYEWAFMPVRNNPTLAALVRRACE